MILATKSSTPIIGQLATVMGWIMDGIYRLLNIFGIHFQYPYLCSYDPTADQTAEVFQTECDHAAGTSEDSEEV